MNINQIKKIRLDNPVGFEKLQARIGNSGDLPIWNFDFPVSTMILNERIDDLLHKLLEDIDKNPDSYEFNRVVLIDDDQILERKTVVCVLPRRAFRGYVEDIIELFNEQVRKAFYGI